MNQSGSYSTATDMDLFLTAREELQKRAIEQVRNNGATTMVQLRGRKQFGVLRRAPRRPARQREREILLDNEKTASRILRCPNRCVIRKEPA